MLTNSYHVDKIMFRFGVDNTAGSDHSIDGKAYALEVSSGTFCCNSTHYMYVCKCVHVHV